MKLGKDIAIQGKLREIENLKIMASLLDILSILYNLFLQTYFPVQIHVVI